MIKVSHIDPALYARLKGHTQSKSRLSAPEKLGRYDPPMGWITNKMAMDVVKITTALIDSRVLNKAIRQAFVVPVAVGLLALFYFVVPLKRGRLASGAVNGVVSTKL